MRKNRNYFLTILILAALPAISLGSEKEVEFAAIYPLSGPVVEMGQNAKRGIELAVEEINQAGGIQALGGAKLKAIWYDTESKPEAGRSVAERACEKGAAAIIGAVQSNVTLLTTTVAEKNKKPHLVCAAVADTITERGYQYTFRVLPSGGMLVMGVVEFLNYMREKSGKKFDKLVVFHEDGPYGKSYFDGYSAFSKKFGFNILAGLGYPAATHDLTAIVTKGKALNPDFVMHVGYLTDAVLLLRSMKEQKFNALGVHGSGGFAEEKFISSMGKDAEYIFADVSFSPLIDAPGAPKGRNKLLQEKSIKKYGVPMTHHTAFAFTSVYILKDALERAKSTEGKELRDAIARTDLMGDRGNILPYEKIKFNEKGQNIFAKVPVAQIQRGEQIPIFPAAVATAQPPFPIPKWEER